MTFSTANSARNAAKLTAVAWVIVVIGAMTTHGATAGDIQFEIQMATSDLQNASNTPTRAKSGNPAVTSSDKQTKNRPRGKAGSSD